MASGHAFGHAFGPRLWHVAHRVSVAVDKASDNGSLLWPLPHESMLPYEYMLPYHSTPVHSRQHAVLADMTQIRAIDQFSYLR